MEFRIWKSRIT